MIAPRDFVPWLDRGGRFSSLRLVTFLLVIAPAAWMAFQGWAGLYGKDPTDAALHEAGPWTVRFLLLTLAVTPARFVLGSTKPIAVRRMLGIAALCYALLHFLLYIATKQYALAVVTSEIVLRFYLTIGFVAVAGLVALGATSTDAMVKRLTPPRWRRLHQWAYPITLLAILHFLIQAKLNISEPTVMAGLFVWLMGVRAMYWTGVAIRPVSLVALAVLCCALTAGIEAGWYGAFTGVPGLRVLAANIDLAAAPRPSWWVAAATLAAAAAAWFAAPPAPRRAARV